MNWDDIDDPLQQAPRSFRFEADLLYNHAPGTNRVWAYKFGPAGEWYNEFFPNLESLEWSTARDAGRKIKSDLYVAVPADQQQLIAMLYMLRRPNNNLDGRLRLHVFDSAKNVRYKAFVFHQVALKQDATPYTMSVNIPFTKKSLKLPLPALVFKLKYNDMTVVI